MRRVYFFEPTMSSQPIEFMTPPAEAAFVLLPVRATVFAERAERFKTLASGHSLADWLNFIGQLTAAQDALLQSLPPLTLPPAETLAQAHTHGMPPLNVSALARPALWRELIPQLVDALSPHAPAAAQSALAALRNTSAERLERMAEALLDGHPAAEDLPHLPFVAAALQVVWTALASQLEASSIKLLEPKGICPCCGSLPVASIVRTSSGVNNLRYLHCSLCNSEWNLARAACSSCATDKRVSLQQIDGSDGAVRAECCDACHSYLKIMTQEKAPAVDPVADDLASLALDLLVDESGYARSGPNLFLLGGAA
jgi:FdhE protein